MPSSDASSRLLVVDDDSTALLICKTHFEKAGHQVETALSVEQARNHIARHGIDGFDAIFTDYRMPVENGLVLLKHVAALDSSLAVIVMTAEGDRELIMSSLRQGAHDFIDKPLSKAILLESARVAIAATRQHRDLRADARAARAVGQSQRFLLGRETGVHHERLCIRHHPHQLAGGDFAATFHLDENRVVVLISDVSGHDLRAAFHSAYLQGLARGLLHSGRGLREVFGQINQLLLKDWNHGGRTELSLAACAILVDQRAGSLSLLSCGLPHPVFSGASGWIVENDFPGSSPLGWFDEIPPVITRPLGQGLLHFWSDGLEDLANNLDVSPFALAYRLKDDSAPRHELLSAANDDIIVGHLDLFDVPELGRHRHPLIDESHPAGSQDRIDDIQARFERSLSLALPDLLEERMISALICLREALLNALVHGCGPHPDRRAWVKVAYDPVDRHLHLCVSDNGPGHAFDLETHEHDAADSLCAEHRGLILMKHLSDRFQLSDHGSRLTMEISVQPP